MSTFKKIRSPLIVILLLAVLPIGSYYYLHTGLNYYKENMQMLDKKGELAEFSLEDRNGKTVTKDSLFGYASIFGVLDNPCKEDCQKRIHQLVRIQEQFYKTGTVKLNSIMPIPISENPEIPAPMNWESEVKPKTWNLLFGQSDEVKTMKWNLVPGQEAALSPNKFVLVDDSLNIRNYYDATDSVSVDLLIRHMAMIMPKKKKAKVVLEREKEK